MENCDESGLLLFFFQAQCGGIDTESHTCGLRAIFENMSQVRVATAANCLRARHSVAHVALQLHIFGCYRLIVTWPPGAGVELRVRAEERLPAANTDVGTLFFRVGVFAGERRLSSFFTRNFKLFVGKRRTPFRIALFYFFAL